jgi:GNAT superfamily N-acetyltransferase
MTSHPMQARARAMWAALTGVDATFPEHGSTVVVAPESGLCPPSWVGVVSLGDAALVTVPTPQDAARMRRLVAAGEPAALTDPTVLAAAVPMARRLGPATLAYLPATRFRPVGGPRHVRRRSVLDPVVTRWLAGIPEGDLDESGIAEITSPAFVASEAGQLVAASGYRTWPCGIAHVSVLTAPGARGRGWAQAVASAAVGDAREAGLLPQWRARPEASRRVARALGFRELGSQLSVLLAPPR